MKWMTLVIALAASLHAATAEEEIEIYRGEEFTSPGAGYKEELHFARVFTVGREELKKQPKADVLSKPSLSVTKAIELAEASLEPSTADGDDDAHITKLELLHQSAGDPHNQASSIRFYVVTFHVDGSDLLRLVLMDGTVVKPQLTRIAGETKD